MPEQKTLSVLSVLLIFVYFSFQSMRLWMVFQKYYSGYRKLNIYIYKIIKSHSKERATLVDSTSGMTSEVDLCSHIHAHTYVHMQI